MTPTFVSGGEGSVSSSITGFTLAMSADEKSLCDGESGRIVNLSFVVGKVAIRSLQFTGGVTFSLLNWWVRGRRGLRFHGLR